MNNPTTIDRRDVAHPTNPIGGETQIEQDDPGTPPARTGKASNPLPADRKGTTGGPLDIEEDELLQHLSDRDLKGGTPAELEPDALANPAATAEIAREQSDVYMVRTDLEDDDERGPSPGMKDQR